MWEKLYIVYGTYSIKGINKVKETLVAINNIAIDELETFKIIKEILKSKFLK